MGCREESHGSKPWKGFDSLEEAQLTQCHICHCPYCKLLTLHGHTAICCSRESMSKCLLDSTSMLHLCTENLVSACCMFCECDPYPCWQHPHS